MRRQEAIEVHEALPLVGRLGEWLSVVLAEACEERS